MNAKAKPLVDEEARFLLNRAHKILPANARERDFIGRLAVEYRQWGWLSGRQKHRITQIISRYSEPVTPIKTKRGKVICGVCKRKRIHPNDALFETGVCFTCQSILPQPASSTSVDAGSRSGLAREGAASNGRVQPAPRAAVVNHILRKRDGTGKPGTTNVAEAMGRSVPSVLKPLKNLSADETLRSLIRMHEEAKR